MATEHGGSRRAVRRLGAAALLSLAIATGIAAEDQSSAQVPGAPSPPIELPPLPVEPPPAPAPRAPAPVEPPAVPVEPPAVPVEPPSVPVKPPSVPVRPPAVPRVDVPRVDAPRVEVPRTAPRVAPPRVDAPRTGARSGPAEQAPSISELGLPDVTAVTGGGARAVAPGSAADLAAAVPGLARLPSRSELAQLPPAARRKLLRAAFDTPLQGRRLRGLRQAIREHGDCMGALSRRGRLALQLRAGLVGDAPATRREVARRLGTSPAAVLRLERSALRTLLGACAGAGGAAATARNGEGGGPGVGADGGGSPGDGGSAGGDPRPAGDLLADAHQGGPGIDIGDGSQGPTEALLFFLLTLLALLGPVAAAMALRQRRTATATTAAGRPLLFLDVDGVIALDPLADPLPPGRIRAAPYGMAYVPDRAGELVRRLARRFEIVWASGWEQRVNTSLVEPLGLSHTPPVLTFGRRARAGSATWKIKPIADYAGNRPVAWVDDHFVGRHERWAAHRPQPTLLVRADSRAGLTADHVERLLRWADEVDGSGPDGSRIEIDPRYAPNSPAP